MWLTKVSIERPVSILMLFGAIAVLGWRSFTGMLVELHPKIDIPYVTVMTTYPAAGPEEVERLVTEPLEKAVSSVNGVKYVTSTSRENLSIVVVEFLLETDINVAVADVRQRVDAAVGELPLEVEKPVISKLDISAMPILTIGVTSSLPARDTKRIAENEITDRFQSVPGVASVSATGGEDREIQVLVDRGRLEAYGLTPTEVAATLGAENLDLPSGTIKEPAQEFAVRVLGEFDSVDEIRDARLHFPGRGPRPDLTLRLSDLAEVRDTVAERSAITRVDQRDSVTIAVQKSSEANTVQVADGIKAVLPKLQQELPGDFAFSLAMDESDRVRSDQAEMRMHIILDILLVVLVVFFFLQSVRGTAIVSLAIPTCLVAVFIPMYFLGFTMNTMTMLAIALVIGILVDDAIVVLESIYRHLSAGESPKEAAYNGRTEIGLAAVTITMTDVVVFVPIAFMGGIVGRFFRQFGLTVAMATLFSLFVSFTLTPMLASRVFHRGEGLEGEKRGFFGVIEGLLRRLRSGYRKVLGWALHHRGVVIGLGFLTLFVVTGAFMPRLGFEFFPTSDRGQVAATIELPTGASLEETDRVVRRLEAFARRIPEAKTVVSYTGKIAAGFRGSGEQASNYGMVEVGLIDKMGLRERLLRPLERHRRLRTRSDQDIVADLRGFAQRIPGAQIKVMAVTGFGGAEAPLEIELRGQDMEELNRVSEQLRSRIATVPGIMDTDLSWRVGRPEVQVKVDREKAASMGFSVGEIARVLRDSMEGNTDYRYREGGEEYDLRVQLPKYQRESISQVASLLVGYANSTPVRLQDVADVRMGTGPTKIERKSRERQVLVVARPVPGYPVGNAQVAIDKEIADIPLGSVKKEWGGQIEIQRESNRNMGAAMGLAVILVYMLMAALFESWVNPFVIMFCLPMALVGALLALVLTGNTLSIISMIGFIMLMGLVTKNAILLIDYTNTLRARGMTREEAILEAGPTRLRPILMTTFSIIFGLMPIALKLGAGAEERAPLAVAVQGGLILSTLLTLVVIPCLYSVFDDVTTMVKGLWRRVSR